MPELNKKNHHAVALGQIKSEKKSLAARKNWKKAVASGKLGRPKKEKKSLDNIPSVVYT